MNITFENIKHCMKMNSYMFRNFETKSLAGTETITEGRYIQQCSRAITNIVTGSI